MVPIIGYMIGFYILTRGVEMIVTERAEPKARVMNICAVLMMGATGFLLLLLMSAEFTPRPSPFMPMP